MTEHVFKVMLRFHVAIKADLVPKEEKFREKHHCVCLELLCLEAHTRTQAAWIEMFCVVSKTDH